MGKDKKKDDKKKEKKDKKDKKDGKKDKKDKKDDKKVDNKKALEDWEQDKGYLGRRMKEAQDNLERFPERTEGFLKDIDERLAIVNARGDYLSNGHITADLANFMRELKEYQGRRNVVLAREERDRDLLEYGLDWQLRGFVNALKGGIPTDKRFVEDYLQSQLRVKQLLVTWLENFRSKFEGRPEAQATIDEVRDALDLYTKVIDGSKAKLEVDQLRDARSPNSVLEYGIEYELRVFNGSIKKGVPTDDRFVDTYLTDLAKSNARLIEWLEDFRSKVGHYDEAQATIEEVEQAFRSYKTEIGGSMVKVNIDKAIRARKPESVLEYGLNWQLERFVKAIKEGVPTDNRFVDDYLKNQETVNGLLVQWLEDFRSKWGEYDEAKPTIEEVENALKLYKTVMGGAMTKVNIDKAIEARRPTSVFDNGLNWHLERFVKDINKGIPTDNRFVDDYLNELSTTNGLLVQWLEDFKSKWGEFEEAKSTIEKVEDSLKLYKTVIGGSMLKVNIQKAVEARSPNSVLEYGLMHHLGRFERQIKSGIPTDNRFIDDHLKELSTVNNLLIQWLEDFKSKFGEYEEAQPTIKSVEEALQLYKVEVGGAMLMVNIQKAVEARSPNSVFDNGLNWHLERFVKDINKGIPTDNRFIDDYLNDLSKTNSLLLQWLEDFKSRFGEHEESHSTIRTVEDALKLYKEVIGGSMLKVNIQKAVEARSPQSVLEYGLDWHLERFVKGINKGIPTDNRFIDDYLNELSQTNGLLLQWLEDFKSKFGGEELAVYTIDKVEDALKLYKTVIGGSMLKVNIQKAVEARTPHSVLEYGLDYHLGGFERQINKGIPTDNRFVNDYLNELEKTNGLLIQWLEDFKSKFGEHEEARSTIDRVEEGLKLYKIVIGGAMLKVNIDRAIEARHPNSVLEYGLKYHLEGFVKQIKKGIPTDNRFVDQHLSELATTNGLLVQWLEDFKSKFGEHEEARETISSVEEGLLLYKTEVGGAMLKVNIEKAIEARSPTSVLEYGLTWHLERFEREIQKGVPTDQRFVDEYLDSLSKTNGLLVQWLEDFKSKFGGEELARPTVEKVEAALALYKQDIGGAMLKVNIDKAIEARHPVSVLEYGLRYHLDGFVRQIKKGIPTDNRFIDQHLQELTKTNGLLVQWLEDFKSKFGDEDLAQPTIKEVEEAFELYKKEVGTKMLKVNIDKAIEARTPNSVLEYGLNWHLERFNKAVDQGVPTDNRFVDDYLNDLSKTNGLLVQWLEDFKSKFGEHAEALPTITLVEDSLQHYKEKIGAAMLKVNIQKAIEARTPLSILEYGLEYHLGLFNRTIASGIPTDKRFVDDYLSGLQKTKGLLIQWLEDFKSKFGEYEEAKATIKSVEDALYTYKYEIEAQQLKVDIQRARDARAPNSVLEYGLDFHLSRFTNEVKKGLPQDDRQLDTYLSDQAKLNTLLIQWLEDFKAKFGEAEEAQATIQEVEEGLRHYKAFVSSVLVPVKVKKARDARRQDGSVLEYGLEYHLKQFVSQIEKGIPKDDRAVDDYLKFLSQTQTLLLQWLEDFRAKLGEYPEAQPTIQEVEKALRTYKAEIGSEMERVQLRKAIQARRADGSVLEYGLEYHLGILNSELNKGIPQDKRYIDDYIESQTKTRSLLVQWLEDFKSKFGHMEESLPWVQKIEDAFLLYQRVIGGSKLKIDIQKARDARTAQGSVLEYGLEYHLGHFISDLNKGIPTDHRNVDDYVEKQSKVYNLLIEWLEDFRSRFGQYDEAQTTIEEVNQGLALYQKVVLASKRKIDLQKAIEARAPNSVLEYGLNFHLERFLSELKKGIPADKRFVEDYLQTQSNLFNLLTIWLEDFRARFEDFEDSKLTILKVEEALALYKATVLATKVKLDVERARDARTPKSVLEYGLVFHLDRFVSDVKSGIPTDKRRVDEYLEKQSKMNGLLILWLEDFKSRFAEFDEAQETIKQVEDGLTLYKTHVLASKVKLDVERSRDARQKDGSVLEYGLEHHLTRFTSEIKKGIPTDKRFIDNYLESLAKEYNLLIQWLEEFRSKLGEYEEAQETIKEVSEALKLYRTTIAASKVKLDVQRAVDARREQGSVLEYGLDHHLTRFVNAIKSGIPTEPRFRDPYLAEQSATNDRLVQWLEDFRSKFEQYEESHPTIKMIEDALKLYKLVVGSAKAKIDIAKAREARRAEGSILEYGLEYHLNLFISKLKEGIPKDDREVDHYIEEQTKTNGLLIEWLEDFKSRFSDFNDASDTINQVEEGLQLYKSVVGASKAKIDLQKAIKARRTEGSVLEYGLDFHLSRFVDDLNKGIPTDKRFIDDYLEEQTRVNGLLITWLEEFRSRFEHMVEAQEVIKRVEDALKLYKTNILASRIKVDVQRARDAKRTDGSVLEYGFEYHLSRFVASLRQGIPQDKSKVGEYVDSLTTVKGLLVQWLEDFKARYGEYEEGKTTIYEVETALKRYNKNIGGAKLAVELRAAIENRSICEYGVEWHLKKFNDQLVKSMPAAVKEAQEWAHELSKTQTLLVRWLEDFRAKFAYVDEANEVISRVEDSLKKFKSVFGKSVVPLAIQQARNARAEDGSILEYGLEFHLQRFTNVIKKGLPKDVAQAKEWTETLKKTNSNLIQWLEEFRSQFVEYEEAQPTIQEVEEALRLYTKIVGGAQLAQQLQQAVADRSLLEFGVEWHLEKFMDQIKKGKPKEDKKALEEYTKTLLRTYHLLVQWLEDFRARFTYASEGEKIISRVDAALKLYDSLFGKPARAPPVAVSSGGTGSSEDPEAAAAAAAAATYKYIYQWTVPEPTVETKDASSSGSALLSHPTIEAISADRHFPSELSYAAGIMKEVLRKEDTLKEALGKRIILTVTWAFSSHSAFTKHCEDDQKKMVSPLAFGLMSKFVTGDEGLIGLCEKSKVTKGVVLEKITKVELTYDPEDKATTPSTKDFNLNFEDGTLKIVVNLSSWKSPPAGFEKEFEKIFNLVFLKALGATDTQKTSIENALATYLGNKTPVLFDFSFTSHPNFASLSAEKQASSVEKLIASAKKILISTNGLGDAAKASSTIGKALGSRLKKVVVTYDASNGVKSKISECTFCELFYHNGTLSITINLDSFEKQVTGIDEKIEDTFHLTVLRAVDSYKTKITGWEATFKKKVGVDVFIEVDWRWATHANFLKETVETRRSMVEKLVITHFQRLLNAEKTEGLVSLYEASKPEVRSTFSKSLRRIVIRYDPTNTIEDKLGPVEQVHWRNQLFDDGELIFEGNLSRWNRDWAELASKVVPAFESDSLRRATLETKETARKAIATVIGKSSFQISVPTDFIRSWQFLKLSFKERSTLTNSLQTIHLNGIVKVVTEMALHHIGKATLHSKVSKIIFKVLFAEGSKVPYKYHYHPSTSGEGGEIDIEISLGNLNTAKPIDLIKLQWILGVSVEIAKDLGLKSMAQISGKCKSACGCEIAVELDWKFASNEVFLSKGAESVVFTIRKLTNNLVERALIDGIIAVCTHPVGKDCVSKSLKKLAIDFLPEDNHGRDSELSIVETTLGLTLNPSTLEAAIVSRYKERIEFEYDLIVAIAKDNASAGHLVVEERLTQKLGLSSKIQIETDLIFTKSNEYKSRPPPEQADIIKYLHHSIPEKALTSEAVGLFGVLSHTIGKAAFLKYVDSVRFEVDQTGHAPISGSLVIVGKTLVFTFNLVDVVDQGLVIEDWKERILELIGVLVPVSILEVSEEKSKIEGQLASAFNKKLPINIPLEFTTNQQWELWHPTKKVTIIKKLHTTFLSTLILGNQGFTGEKGLREFQPVIDLLNSKLSNIQIQVTLAKDTEKKVAPEHVNDTLRFFVDLDNLVCDKFSGCHTAVEDLFQLRSIKEAAAKARGDQNVLQENKDLLQALGGHVTIAIDWDSFTQTPKFKNDAGYVDFIDKIAGRPKVFLVSSGNDWGTLSVNEMVQNSPAVKSGLCNFNRILIRFDPNNKAHQKIGQASTLTATAVHVQSANPDFIITVNLDSPLNCGCGRHLQNVFAQSEFLASEEKTIQSIAESMRRREEESRKNQIARAHENNKDKQNRYNKDIEDYNKKMKEYQKELNAKCTNCEQASGKKKCNICQGRGNNTNNNHTSTCSSCKGSGKLTCSYCDGTGKKHPRGCSEPSQPHAPTLDSIPTFGPLPNYRSMI